jgi:hypothetical protein
MSPFDYEMVQPIPQRRASQHSLDNVGNDVDITTLWFKTQQLLTYIEQLTVYVNDQSAIITTLQTQAETQAIEIVALNARVAALEGV